MATSYLIGKVEIDICKRIDSWCISYHPYERPVWIDRLERNIQTINEYGIALERVFDTYADAERHIEAVLDSIARDYQVPSIRGSSEYIRHLLYVRLGVAK